MARKSRRANVVQEKKEELQVFASIITQKQLVVFSSPFFLCMTSKIISFFFLVDFFSVLAYNEHS